MSFPPGKLSNRHLLILSAALLFFVACLGGQVTVPTADPYAIQTYIVETANALAALNTSTTPPTLTSTPTATVVQPTTQAPPQPNTPISALPTENAICVYCKLECPYKQGDADFLCLADPQLVADQNLFEMTLKTFCDLNAGDYCQVLVWADASYLPTALPMSDEQLYYEVADYSRNKFTGYDCFIMSSQGKELYRSGQCGGSLLPTATQRVSLQPTNPPSSGQACSCAGDTLNCSDFSSHSEAQSCFEYCLTITGKDIHRLDGDNNGLACENL